MKIKKMKESDLFEVARVFRAVFNHAGERWTEETSGAYLKKNYVDGSSWVMIEGDAIVGFLTSGIHTREEGPELYIDTIAVLPEYQGKGVGSALWKEAESYAKEHTLSHIRLLAKPGLQSFEWYQHMGFTDDDGWIELSKKL